MKKRFVAVGIALIMLFGIFALSGCSEKASKYTEAEHVKRVTERIQKRYMTSETKHTGFEVFPLYDENDKLTHFLVEFEPYGFRIVLLKDEEMKAFSWTGTSTSMYRLSLYFTTTWSPYTIDETNSQPYPDIEKIWELNENGEKIVFDKSPYYIAGVEGEPLYLLNGYIPAVKQGEKFKNLISQEEFGISNGTLTKSQAGLRVAYIAKKNFDL